MPKLQFGGLYKNAKEIPPKQIMAYYLKGDQAERREAGNEILRRLSEDRKLVEAAQAMATAIEFLVAELGPVAALDELGVALLYGAAAQVKGYANDVLERYPDRM